MSTEENKALVRRWYAEVSRGNAAISAEIVSHDYRMNGLALGPQGARRVSAMVLAAFPDWHVTVGDMIAEGDKVAAHITYAGTHRGVWPGRGPIQGLAPTGKPFAMAAVEFFRIVDGKIAEVWTQSDFPSMAEQLGVSGAPEPGGR